ncbi:MAG: PEGA domain-containing protein [Planctomycetota bacterium]|nr:PEGA domain-containing protein [Planctomycetota bacterium]
MAALTVGLLALVPAGCTSRGMTVTSIPEGAEVSINRRVVGRTPVRVNYTHYGSYRIELRQEKYETLVRTEKVRAPWYGFDPLSFFADNVVPMRINDEVSFHYVMTPIDQGPKREGLLDRALQARDGNVIHPGTGEAIAIDLGQTSKRVAIVEPESTVARPRAEGPAAVADLTLPEEAPKAPVAEAPQPAPPRAIEETKPEGPRIAKEMGLDQPEAKPEEEKKTEPEAAPPARMRRTPKGEILIYKEESIEDPDKK